MSCFKQTMNRTITLIITAMRCSRAHIRIRAQSSCWCSRGAFVGSWFDTQQGQERLLRCVTTTSAGVDRSRAHTCTSQPMPNSEVRNDAGADAGTKPFYRTRCLLISHISASAWKPVRRPELVTIVSVISVQVRPWPPTRWGGTNWSSTDVTPCASPLR